ncbi:MAG: VWA domain-containing protein [Thermoanaerobaculia bacterium]
MRSAACRIGVASLALLLATSPFSAQSRDEKSAVREEAKAVLIEVPVNVIDRNGNPVEGLTAEDFEVFDDGKKQPITGFEILDQRRPIPKASPGEPPIHPSARRHFLLLFDLSFGSPKGIVNARRAARDFVVTRMKELDLAAVATYSIEDGMKLLVTFTGDRTQLAAAIDTLGFPTLADRTPDPLAFVLTQPSGSNATGFAFLRGSSASTGSGFDIALEEALENLEIIRGKNFRAIYRDRVSRLLGSLADLARALDSVQGRKHIFYLSEGFDSRELSGSTSEGGGARESEWVIRGQSWKVDNDTRFGNAGTQSRMSQSLTLFNRSDCVIHAIDIGGLRAGSEITGLDQRVSGSDSLFYMAEATGGEFLKNANDLGPSFDRLLDRTGLIYILAFQPVRVPETGKFHTLTVKTRNKAYRVSHRTGYYEAKKYLEMSPIEKKLAASSAIAAAVPKTDVPAWVLAASFPGSQGLSRVPVIVEIPGDRLLKGHQGNRASVDVYAYAMDGQGTTRDYLFHTIGLDLTKAEAMLRRSGVKYYGEMSLPTGDYTLRVLVRNNETGRTGVTITPLSVSEGVNDPFLLPPLFVDGGQPWILVKGRSRSAQPAGEYPFSIGGESFVPAALADVHSGEEAQVCVIAYNFAGNPDPLQYSGRVLGLDGRPHGKVELKLVKASDREREGARKLLLRFRPAGLEPGRYALAIQLKDPRSGKTAESSVPFDVQ